MTIYNKLTDLVYSNLHNMSRLQLQYQNKGIIVDHLFIR